MTRHYVDKQNKRCKVQFVAHKGYTVHWHKSEPDGLQQAWRLEDGSIVHIPANAWEVLDVEYADTEEMS